MYCHHSVFKTFEILKADIVLYEQSLKILIDWILANLLYVLKHLES